MPRNPNAVDNLRPYRDSERARECQKKSAESHKRNKTVREITAHILAQPVTDPKQLAAIEKAGLPVGDKPTYNDFMVASIILRTVQKGRARDLLDLQSVLGETIAKDIGADVVDDWIAAINKGGGQ